MRTDSTYLALSSLAAVAGAAIGAYQVLSPSAGKTPVEVSLRLDDVKPKADSPMATAEAASSGSITASQGKQQLTDSAALLRNIRASLAVVATGYGKKAVTTISHQSSSLVVKSAGETARSIEELEVALRSGQPRSISAVTAKVSKSIAKLKATYALVPDKNERVAAGMRGVDANWTAYATRYILMSPPTALKSFDPARVRALKQGVARLTQRVAVLERQTAKNRALNREISRLRTELVYIQNRVDTYQSYQAVLLTLTMVSGAFDALSTVTHDYYPRYYSYFEPSRGETDFWERDWTEFYDGYYARDRAWYTEDFAVPDQIVLVPTQEIYSYQHTSYQEIIQISEESSVFLDSLPVEDLSAVEIPPPEASLMSWDSLVEPSPSDESATAPTDESATVPTDESATFPADESATVPADESATLPTDESAAVPTDESAPVPTEEPVVRPAPNEPQGAEAYQQEAPEILDTNEAQSPGDAETGQMKDDASMEELSPSVEEPFETGEGE